MIEDQFLSYIREHLPEALYFCQNDSDRTVIELNRSARALLGLKNMGEEKIKLKTFLPEESLTPLHASIEKAIESKKDYSLDYPLVTYHGSTVWVNDHGVGVFDEKGECFGIIGCLKNITPFVMLQRELKQKKAEAEEASQAKSKFIATLNHELRAPVSGIISLASLLLDSSLNPDQQRQVENIKESSEILLSLINDILDFSKITAGKVELELKECNLLKIAERVLSMVQPLAKDKKVQLSILKDPNLPDSVIGDQTRLQQILLNFLSNAVKFTAQGSITLAIKKGQRGGSLDRILFEVTDTGIGISEKNIQNLFKDFTQGHIGINRSYGGTGLGLSICKKLVTLMGGDIGVHSREGQGSTFWFEVALPPGRGTIHTPTTLPEIHPASHPHPLNLLVAEDNIINQEVILGLIRKLGDYVKIATNGQEAVDLFQQESFDVILTDINMPIMDGVTATKEIRKLPHGRDIPIIAVTANSISSDHEMYLKEGITSILTKPIDKEKLAASLLPYRYKTKIQTALETQGSGETAPSCSLIQVETLKGLVEDLGKEKMLRLLDIYKGDATILINNIEAASGEERCKSAHTLAGMAENLGILSVGKAARTIMALSPGDENTIHLPLAELRALYEASLKEVDEVIGS